MHELPNSSCLNISALSIAFVNRTNSYKYLYFLSLLDILDRRKFDVSEEIGLKDIVVEMLANAWFPHTYFKLSFGTQDKIAEKLDGLNLIISKPILKFQDTDKKLLRGALESQVDSKLVWDVSRYVTYRLIRPFFRKEIDESKKELKREGKKLKDQLVNPTILNLANSKFSEIKPLYHFNADRIQDCTAIIFSCDWANYFKKNFNIVKGWVSWEWLQYMQDRNPNTPNIASKLFISQERGNLKTQREYWERIVEYQSIKCIYSKQLLSRDNLSLDHYLPWSFVAHDRLWNLIPTHPSTNSSKSNNLPANIYFDEFVELQHLGLVSSYRLLGDQKWQKSVEAYISELKINNPQDLLEIEKLRKAYELTINPLISLATSQGFTPNWLYS